MNELCFRISHGVTPNPTHTVHPIRADGPVISGVQAQKRRAMALLDYLGPSWSAGGASAGRSRARFAGAPDRFQGLVEVGPEGDGGVPQVVLPDPPDAPV